jgi:hypothetical protein
VRPRISYRTNGNVARHALPISHSDIRVKHCAYGHSVATLLNRGGVTTVCHKDIVTVARHTTVLVVVSSTVHYSAKSKIKENVLFKMKFKTVNKLFAQQYPTNCLKYHLKKHSRTTTLCFVKENIHVGGDMEVKARIDPCFTLISGFLIDRCIFQFLNYILWLIDVGKLTLLTQEV